MKTVNKESRFDQKTVKKTQVDKMIAQRLAWQGHRAVKGVGSNSEWKKGGHGQMEDVKPDNCVRVLLENYNNLQYFTD